MLIRWAQGATASRSATIGSANTYCSEAGSYLSCSTTPAPTITIPGNAGGAVSTPALLVIDCKESTWVYYRGEGKPAGDWKKKTSGFEICKEINELPTLEYSL